MKRRSFFGVLFAGAAVPAVAMARPLEPVIATGLAFDCVVCPACGSQQAWPSRHDFPSWAAWADHVTTPHQIHCGSSHCQIPMLAQFARRVVDGRRV